MKIEKTRRRFSRAGNSGMPADRLASFATGTEFLSGA